MRSATCAECIRLYQDSTALLMRYNATFDALALTPRLDQSYADRRRDFANASECLYEAQRLEQSHQDSDHTD
jgi:hypothetical protein